MSMGVGMIIGIIVLFAMAAAGLGWLVPLVWGIVLLACNRRFGGLLLGIGAVWGALVIAGGIALAIFAARMNKEYSPETFDPSTYKGKTATIVIPHNGPGAIMLTIKESSSVLGQSRALNLNSTNGQFIAPAGRIEYVSMVEMRATDPAGTKWTARTWLGSHDEGSNATELKEGQTLNLDVGPPFKAIIKPGTRPNGEVSMNLNITGLGEHSYTITADSPAVTSGSPSFQVLDESGKVLWEQNLEYG